MVPGSIPGVRSFPLRRPSRYDGFRTGNSWGRESLGWRNEESETAEQNIPRAQPTRR